MLNSELIKKLQALPANMEVMFIQTNDEYSYSMVETVGVQSIKFTAEDIPENEWADVDCVVISD